MAFSYKSSFQDALAALRREGRYRVFADIMRQRGDYPKADFFTDAEGSNGGGRPITVWCSNDYLNMGQHPKVLAAMHEAIDTVGAGSGGTRNISGTTPLSCRAGTRTGRTARQGGGAAVHLRLRLQRRHPGDPGQDPAGPDHLLRRAQPCLDDRGHPPWRHGQICLPPQRHGASGGTACRPPIRRRPS